MRKVKLFSVALVIVFFFSNVSIIPGNRHFIQFGAEKVYGSQALYNYQKYNVTPYYYLQEWRFVGSGTGWIFTGYTSCDLDARTGVISGSGTIIDGSTSLRIYYFPLNSTLYRFEVGDYAGRDSSNNQLYNVNRYIPVIIYAPFKGSLISTFQNVDGVYPDNGIFTDGYWYVKGSLYTNIPQLSIISPSQNGTLFLKTRTSE
jgi:hypothetical protein